ncbi:uncharacterized protein PG998_004743 [Apiospora kogelbergensis]|uniref:uncharacterized protein n=1 Tax=Apiospora kogelbergensis TaxID=1337665 RepID=UPI0031327535
MPTASSRLKRRGAAATDFIVHHQHGRVAQHRDGQRELVLHAAGPLRGHLCGVRGEPDLGQGAVDDLGSLAGADFLAPGVELEVNAEVALASSTAGGAT